MKRLFLLGAIPALLSSCISSPSQAYNHWSADSIAPSMALNFLGYQPDVDGTYRHRLWKDRKNLDLLLTRHFLSWNPESPFQKDDPSYHAERPPLTPLPNPLPYVVLLPGSIIGSFEEGGGEEFWSGFGVVLEPLRTFTVSFVNETVGPNGPILSIFTCGEYEYPESTKGKQHPY